MLHLNVMSSQELKDFKWKNRILLLVDHGNNLEKSELQLRKFKAQLNEMQERDLILFVYNGKNLMDIDGTLTNIKMDNVPYNDYQGVILIGKDGGVKLRKKFVVEATEIFELIDQMPMRRSEMKHR